jgi:hypothetical protein
MTSTEIGAGIALGMLILDKAAAFWKNRGEDGTPGMKELRKFFKSQDKKMDKILQKVDEATEELRVHAQATEACPARLERQSEAMILMAENIKRSTEALDRIDRRMAITSGSVD